MTLTGSLIQELTYLVHEHELANNLILTDPIEIEESVCKDAAALGLNVCHTETDGVIGSIQKFVRSVKESVGVNIQAANQGANTLISWIKAHGYASQEEANKRAAVCASCPLNTDVTCKTCAAGGLAMRLLNVKRGRRTVHDNVLKHCKVCGCSVLVKVWVPKQVILDNTPAEQMAEFPAHCWIKSNE